MDFDVIPFDDIKWGQRLGAGSFGSVHKGTYLGIDIAIKEVLPSTDYDVHKYFEREWRIMRECRHPNIVLFLGLSRAPEGDDRIFIVSEFVPRGNLRQFILSSYAFPWRLRLSFATDVARAVAYLHARQCIHRDLKGENLLITSNERVKVTDFGFARIASRNAEEMRRMTYCGTDGYMSPEIINGQEFDLPTDVFSLGIIFIEIMCRRLVDSKNFVRQAPSWIPDPAEIKKRLSPGCPPDFLSLALHCCAEKATDRPRMAEVLDRLRAIEVNVLSRLDPTEGEHVGSIKLVRTGKRAMPIFDAPTLAENVEKEQAPDHALVDEGEESDAHIEEEALVALAGLQIDGQGATPARKGHQPRAGHATWRTARWKEAGSELSQYSQYTDASEMRGHQRLLGTHATGSSITSAPHESVESGLGDPVRSASMLVTATPPMGGDAAAASTMTIRGPTTSEELARSTEASKDDMPPASQIGTIPSLASSDLLTKLASALADPTVALDTGTSADGGEKAVPVLQTRYQKEQERKAQVGALGTHRFTLVGKEEPVLGKKPSSFTSTFAFAFLPKVMSSASKCPVCSKKIGQRAALQCDDCSVVVHVKCSHAAPRNCASPATQV